MPRANHVPGGALAAQERPIEVGRNYLAPPLVLQLNSGVGVAGARIVLRAPKARQAVTLASALDLAAGGLGISRIGVEGDADVEAP